MTVLEAVNTHNEDRSVSPLPTLSEALFAQEVRRSDNWIDAMVLGSQRAPKVEIVELTPALATALLSRNEGNRNIVANTVEQYARDIRHGYFAFNGASIVVSKAGILRDGQHRCTGVVKAGESIHVVIVFGVDDEAGTTMDQGRSRKAGDYLSMQGHKNVANLAAAASLLHRALVYNSTSDHYAEIRPTKSETLRIIAEHQGLADSVDMIAPKKEARLVGGPSTLAFCHYYITLKTGLRAEAKQFILSLMDGTGLEADSPILYARNRLFAERGKRRAGAKAEIIIKAWNAFIKGETPKRLEITGKLPEVAKGA